MMIDFNSRGYITPPEAITVDFDTFEQTFVVNNHRQLIFDEYQTFLASLKIYRLNHFFNGLMVVLPPKSRSQTILMWSLLLILTQRNGIKIF